MANTRSIVTISQKKMPMEMPTGSGLAFLSKSSLSVAGRVNRLYFVFSFGSSVIKSSVTNKATIK
jgi:hypothetical protein